MKKKFEIWQTEDRNRMFTNSRVLEKCDMKPELDSSYKKVDEAEIEVDDATSDMETLELIFYKGQFGTYKGRSISVSDIIKLEGQNYFCDDFGFLKIA